MHRSTIGKICTVFALVLCMLACSDPARRYFAENCSSDSECESNLCVAGLCSKSCATDAACGGGVCLDAVCKPITAIPCQAAADCLARIAGGPCREVGCAAGNCSLTSLSDGTACQVNACQSAGSCQKGACALPVAASGCDDGFACTIDYCDPPTGCVHAPKQQLCNDQIACTTDVCTASKGCQNIGDATACTDSDPCTKDTCYADGCHHPPKCDDGNACTFDECSQEGVCANGGPIGMACEDGNLCTYPDACVTGACQSGPAVVCDDSNPCTADSCVPASGCLHAPLTGPSCKGMCGIGACEAGICVGNSTSFEVAEPASTQSGVGVDHLVPAEDNLVAAGSPAVFNAALWKLDSTGKKLWTSNLGLSGIGIIMGAAPLGSGFVATGLVVNKNPPLVPFVAAVDAQGTPTWKYFSTESDGELAAVAQAEVGVVACGSISTSPTKVWLLHLGATGELLSSATAALGPLARAKALAVAGSEVVVVGQSGGQGVLETGFVQKWDIGAKTPKQSVVLGGTLPRRLNAIAPMGTGWLAMGTEGIIGVGMWLVRMDSSLQVQWQSLGPIGRLPNQFSLDNDGLWIVGARDVTDAGSKAWLARYDLWGNQVFERSFAKWTVLGGLARMADGGLAVGGTRTESAGVTAAFVARLTPWGRLGCATSGPCAGLSAADCDDGVACTADDCAPATGCTHTPLAIGAPCDTAGPCKLKHCSIKGCAAGPTIECADSDPCTLDSCSPSGCVHVVVPDGTPCLGSAVCTAGVCAF